MIARLILIHSLFAVIPSAMICACKGDENLYAPQNVPAAPPPAPVPASDASISDAASDAPMGDGAAAGVGEALPSGDGGVSAPSLDASDAGPAA